MAFVFLTWLQSCQQHAINFSVAEMPIINTGNNTVTVIVAENAATTYSENGGFRKTTYLTTYWLKQYNLVSGKLINKKKLFSPAEPITGLSCYGIYNNLIWLYANGMVAYDANSLETITNEKKIAALNNISKSIFPYDARLIYPAIEKGRIDFIATNGKLFSLNLNNLSLAPAAGIGKSEYRANTNTISRYGTRCDTVANMMFAFAKNEAAASECRPGNNTMNESAYRIQFFKVDYMLHKAGPSHIFNITGVHALGNRTWLNPCLAKDTYSNTLIQPANPASLLVIHQDTTGEKSKAILTRIDVNGNSIWESATSVSTTIDHFTFKEKYCVISTNKNYMFSPPIGRDALCIVNIENGQIIYPSLQD
ncbi:MAG TPA: hypothetical protein PKC39_06875 [Ferruginibacter sp.]|nr:hypothetical protein [Ferruginibacter sp.]HMP20663.1 hypothetical protein [Ferruginibacter sp.]